MGSGVGPMVLARYISRKWLSDAGRLLLLLLLLSGTWPIFSSFFAISKRRRGRRAKGGRPKKRNRGGGGGGREIIPKQAISLFFFIFSPSSSSLGADIAFPYFPLPPTKPRRRHLEVFCVILFFSKNPFLLLCLNSIRYFSQASRASRLATSNSTLTGTGSGATQSSSTRGCQRRALSEDTNRNFPHKFSFKFIIM